MKRVLVTGGTGYIGSALVPALLAEGHEVHVLARHAPTSAHPQLSTTIGDIRDPASVKTALNGVTHVVHLAGIPGGKESASINQTAFLPLLEQSAAAGTKRFLFVSTSALYGDGSPTACDETATPKPLNDYAAQKLACEQILQSQCPSGMEYTILRPGAICGLAPALRLDMLSHLLVRDACSKGTISVQGASHYRPHLHIADMARACVTLLDAPRAQGEIFNLALDNLTIMELAERVQALVAPQVTIDNQPTADTRSYRIDSQKITRYTGFSPLFSVDSAIKEVAAAIRSGAIADPYDLRYYPSKRQFSA